MIAVTILSAMFLIVGIIVARLMRWAQPFYMGIALGGLVWTVYVAYRMGAF